MPIVLRQANQEGGMQAEDAVKQIRRVFGDN